MEATLGAFLREEREARGVALSDIATETKVPESALQSIEEDRFDDLPGEVFVRGFLRAYARSIDIDPDEVLSRLDRPAPRPTLPKVHATDRDLRRRRMATPALLLVLLIAIALIAIVLWRPVAMPSFSVHTPTPPTGTAG